MKTHNPTPWRIDRWRDERTKQSGVSILDRDGHVVARMVQQIADNEVANAQAIVAAVNTIEAERATP